jgi:hypothetical protein
MKWLLRRTARAVATFFVRHSHHEADVKTHSILSSATRANRIFPRCLAGRKHSRTPGTPAWPKRHARQGPVASSPQGQAACRVCGELASCRPILRARSQGLEPPGHNRLVEPPVAQSMAGATRSQARLHQGRLYRPPVGAHGGSWFGRAADGSGQPPAQDPGGAGVAQR